MWWIMAGTSKSIDSQMTIPLSKNSQIALNGAVFRSAATEQIVSTRMGARKTLNAKPPPGYRIFLPDVLTPLSPSGHRCTSWPPPSAFKARPLQQASCTCRHPAAASAVTSSCLITVQQPRRARVTSLHSAALLDEADNSWQGYVRRWPTAVQLMWNIKQVLELGVNHHFSQRQAPFCSMSLRTDRPIHRAIKGRTNQF